MATRDLLERCIWTQRIHGGIHEFLPTMIKTLRDYEGAIFSLGVRYGDADTHNSDDGIMVSRFTPMSQDTIAEDWTQWVIRCQRIYTWAQTNLSDTAKAIRYDNAALPNFDVMLRRLIRREMRNTAWAKGCETARFPRCPDAAESRMERVPFLYEYTIYFPSTNDRMRFEM